MSTNAISVANYLIDKSLNDRVELKQFGLMKRVYIVHGFSLAIFDLSALDRCFDVVEAWKNGPVIPSVYHSFKHNGNNPITEKSCIVDLKKGGYDIKTPELENRDIRLVADMVWKRYKGMDDFAIVEMLHRAGTPWALCYEEGKNKIIPDLYTKVFYKKLIEDETGRKIA